MSETETSGPNPVDIHVGARVRMRRKLMGMSQEVLAGNLGLTFQQVQKYERGTSRISASKLYEASRALTVPVAWFFEGIDGAGEDAEISGSEVAVNSFLFTGEGVELAAAFPRIVSPKQRRKMLDLVRALAEDEVEAAG